MVFLIFGLVWLLYGVFLQADVLSSAARCSPAVSPSRHGGTCQVFVAGDYSCLRRPDSSCLGGAIVRRRALTAAFGHHVD